MSVIPGNASYELLTGRRHLGPRDLLLGNRPQSRGRRTSYWLIARTMM